MNESPKPLTRLPRPIFVAAFVGTLIGAGLFQSQGIRWYSVVQVADLLQSTFTIVAIVGLAGFTFYRWIAATVGYLDKSPKAPVVRVGRSVLIRIPLLGEISFPTRLLSTAFRRAPVKPPDPPGPASAPPSYSVVADKLRTTLLATAPEAVSDDLWNRWTLERRVTSATLRFSESRDRLLDEIDAQARRGNVNLIIGMCLTLVALAALIFVVFFQGTLQAIDTPNVLNHWVPRALLVAFIQSMSLFFLGLYRTSLLEIKVFQNELTNVEFRMGALIAAAETGDKDMLRDILITLVNTDRALILNKDQTTVALEEAKLRRQGADKLFESTNKLIEKIPIKAT